MKRYIKSAEGLTSKQRQKIAKNSKDPKELSRLAYDNAASVRKLVAKNPNTPAKALAQLAREPLLQRDVADNPHTSADTLAQLAAQGDDRVRIRVASNPNASVDLLKQLADDDELVFYISRNPMSIDERTKQMKRYIRCGTDDTVLMTSIESEIIDALKSKGITDATLNHIDVYVKPAGSGFRATIQLPHRVAHGKKISEFFYKRDADIIVDNIMKWYDHDIRELVTNQAKLAESPRKQSSTATAVSKARNSNDPDELRDLANHNARTVRKAVAKNPYTPLDALLPLAVEFKDAYLGICRQHEVDEFYSFIQSYPVNRDILRRYSWIAQDSKSSETLQGVFDITTQYDMSNMLNSPIAVLASNHNISAELAWQLYDLNDNNVDWRLSLNSSIPDDVVEALITRYQTERSDVQNSDYIVVHCEAILRGEDPYNATVPR